MLSLVQKSRTSMFAELGSKNVKWSQTDDMAKK